MILNSKRVLLVAPRFFGYELEIRSELVRQGAIVDWLPDRPFDAPTMKALTKLRPNWVMYAADRLYERMLHEFGAVHYDLILVINGQTLSENMLRRLRAAYPLSRFVLYLWDAIANRAHIRENFRMFDQVCTFDPEDAVKYQLLFRPLFYGHGFNLDKTQSIPVRYQISFVGTAHSDRFSVVHRLRSNIPKETPAYWFLYLQAPWVLHYYRWTKPNMRHACADDFSFVPLEKSVVQSVFSASRSILDIEHPQQNGLTMRTFETLGAGKKLVTTNASIRNYDFFSPENVCVIDRRLPQIPVDFLNSPFTPLTEEVLKRYSITTWLAEVLGRQ